MAELTKEECAVLRSDLSRRGEFLYVGDDEDALDTIDALRAKLEAAERERDDARAEVEMRFKDIGAIVEEKAVLRARLEATERERDEAQGLVDGIFSMMRAMVKQDGWEPNGAGPVAFMHWLRAERDGYRDAARKIEVVKRHREDDASELRARVRALEEALEETIEEIEQNGCDCTTDATCCVHTLVQPWKRVLLAGQGNSPGELEGSTEVEDPRDALLAEAAEDRAGDEGRRVMARKRRGRPPARLDAVLPKKGGGA